MTSVAVVAHSGKSFGGGLGELREVLAQEGFPDPLWYEVSKSRRAPKCARRAVAHGADVIFVWGGDGTVQRCIDALVGRAATIAILPAGTANLLATNLSVPTDLVEAVQVGLRGHRRPIDTGSVNGEHFAVMAGAGFDALMIRDADRGMKDRIGRAAYVWTGAKNLTARRGKATVDVDGERFFKGLVSCVLVGNVGEVLGGVKAFKGARPDDGVLELGIVTAKNPVQWTRTLGRVAVGKTEKSPFVRTTKGKKFKISFDRPFAYELDGGSRPSTKRLRIRVHPSSILICVPARANPEIPSGAVDQG
jgi:diacylglycerol kinase (ATP)